MGDSRKEGSMRKLILGGVILLGTIAGAQYESIVHTSKLGPLAVAVTCRNGSVPEVENMKGVVVVSCPVKKGQ